MWIIEKMSIVATAMTKNALGIIIINLVLFTHLNKRDAPIIKKIYGIYSICSLYKFFITGSINIKNSIF